MGSPSPVGAIDPEPKIMKSCATGDPDLEMGAFRNSKNRSWICGAMVVNQSHWLTRRKKTYSRRHWHFRLAKKKKEGATKQGGKEMAFNF